MRVSVHLRLKALLWCLPAHMSQVQACAGLSDRNGVLTNSCKELTMLLEQARAESRTQTQVGGWVGADCRGHPCFNNVRVAAAGVAHCVMSATVLHSVQV